MQVLRWSYRQTSALDFLTMVNYKREMLAELLGLEDLYLHPWAPDSSQEWRWNKAFCVRFPALSGLWMGQPSIIGIPLKILNIFFTIKHYLQNPRAMFQELWFTLKWFGSQNVSISGFSNSELWCRKTYFEKSLKLRAQKSQVAS